MKVIRDGQPDAAGRKLSIGILDGARSLGDNLRKETTIVKMGHGAGRGHPTPLE